MKLILKDMVVVLILKKESSFLMFYKILRLKQWFRRKREARAFHRGSEYARKLTGIKAKIYNKRRRHEKIQIKKTYGYLLGLNIY